MTEMTDRLGFARVEELAEFLLKHMSMETRGLLMAEMPQHYALLYPKVDEAVIIASVQRRMWQVRNKKEPSGKRTSASERRSINNIRTGRGLAPLDDSHFDAMDEIQQRGER